MSQGAPKGNQFAKGSKGGGYNAVIRQLVGLCSKEALILGKKTNKTEEEKKLWNEILLAVIKKAVPTTIEGTGDDGAIIIQFDKRLKNVIT